MNIFYSGKPRSGKTKAAVIWTIDRLRFTERAIVTNMALKFEPWVDGKGRARRGLLRALKDEFGETFDAERRIYLLSNEEVRRFYAIRVRVPRNAWEKREVLRIPEREDGEWRFNGDEYPACDFVIDEAHVFFPRDGLPGSKARAMSPELLGYATQAGRCGDEDIYLSQVLVNVNRQLRGVAQECHWFTNHVHNRMGMFRQADKISYRVYATTPPGPSEMWLAKGTLRYKRDFIEDCYDTGAGVGVSGNTCADIGQRAKGVPSWGIWVLVVVVAIGFMFFAVGIRKGAAFALSMGYDKKAKHSVSGSTNVSDTLFTPAQIDSLKRMLLEARLSRPMSLTEATNRIERPSVSVAGYMKSEPKEDMPVATGYCEGRGANGTIIALDLEGGGCIFGSSLKRRGNVLELDGVQYKLKPKRAAAR